MPYLAALLVKVKLWGCNARKSSEHKTDLIRLHGVLGALPLVAEADQVQPSASRLWHSMPPLADQQYVPRLFPLAGEPCQLQLEDYWGVPMAAMHCVAADDSILLLVSLQGKGRGNPIEAQSVHRIRKRP